MIPSALFSHVALIILAVGIVFTYVKPAFDGIVTKQDRTAVYQAEIKKVDAVNEKLASLMSDLSAVSVTDNRRLLNYMPDAVDSVAVARDLQTIADDIGVITEEIVYEGPVQQVVVYDELGVPIVDINKPEAHTFLFNFRGSYSQVKQFLTTIEQNHYPLEVSEILIEKSEGGFLTVTSKLTTFDSIHPVDPLLVI